ncbi:MAG: polysaccharide deacetylase family protein [Lentimicrobium sp.]|jgi:hypothetical protein|nr:polysaccharide deacetylase family protein [Lentimicrobium sp.]MDD2527780.1 polysaccharide deacetylase family protein [Lentimicrobiaceae bacterium]MDD4598273.1 polysaccharide deacetylase family protein [Lentimicrobiaceae bacterium]MDY0025709.1 polysaccharide deacetylase family protein [Lentimicrobium sp.]
MQNNLLIYTPLITPRITYIFKLILGDLLGLSFGFTSDPSLYQNYTGPVLCYDVQPLRRKEEIFIMSAGLLTEKSISSHQFGFIDFEDSRAFYAVYGKSADIPFDLFSAAFYLVSRYEEYLPHMRDEHNRFSASSSMASQQGFLRVPVVNKWALALGKLLENKFAGIRIQPTTYRFIPTIDIDAAWAYRNKGGMRIFGGYLKDVLTGNFSEIKMRTRVLLGRQNDPFDTYDLMYKLHSAHGLKPWFFILFADYGLNDKNIPVNNADFQTLVKALADYAHIGIHPGYVSNDHPEILKKEINQLSGVLKREITASRQHFLKLNLPYTYRQLLDQDIQMDFTMGFAAEPGFRAGICTPFFWYDLEAEVATSLRVYPFALMEGTLRDYMNLDADEALKTIQQIVDEVKKVGGTFISLWHNESLSDQKRWKGWVRVYEQMLELAAAK